MSEDNAQSPDPAATPPLDESIRQVGAAGRAAADSAKHSLRSLRRLASADFALARSAFGRALAWAGGGGTSITLSRSGHSETITIDGLGRVTK